MAKKSIERHVINILKAIFKGIPFIGDPISSLIEDYFPKRHYETLQKDFDDTFKYWKKEEYSKIIKKPKFPNEEFLQNVTLYEDELTLNEEHLAFLLINAVYYNANLDCWVRKNLKNEMAIDGLFQLMCWNYWRPKWRSALLLERFLNRSIQAEKIRALLDKIESSENCNDMENVFYSLKNNSIEKDLHSISANKNHPRNKDAELVVSEIMKIDIQPNII